MRKIFIALLAVLIASLIAIINMRPDEFRVTRAATVNAAPEVVFAQINNFHNWEAWSPWGKLDPNAKIAYEGPESGVGAKFSWAGNSKIGEGSETIIESRANELVKMDLEFIKPFKGSNTTEFVLKPEGENTSVTWTMYGPSNFMSKTMSIFMDCDKMVGDQFEQGLASLNSVVEKQ